MEMALEHKYVYPGGYIMSELVYVTTFCHSKIRIEGTLTIYMSCQTFVKYRRLAHVASWPKTRLVLPVTAERRVAL